MGENGLTTNSIQVQPIEDGSPIEIENEFIAIVPGIAHDYRCKRCGHMLFRAMLMLGSRVSIRCWHLNCKGWNVIV